MRITKTNNEFKKDSEESIGKNYEPSRINEQYSYCDVVEKLKNVEDIEEELGIDLIHFLKECKYVLEHCSAVLGKTSKGTVISCDFGYVIEFINDIKEALKIEELEK